MGVPSFFSWWASQYSDLILSTNYEKFMLGKKHKILYLDFNGAIHPAIRNDPDLKLEDMFDAVMTYLENIVTYNRPDEIYIAIDGVAPSAKMAQQRDRRYKSVKEAKLLNEIAVRHGRKVRKEQIDFNMISPATIFMEQLQQHLEKNVTKLKIKTTINGSDVPGEGEHKIMSDIRSRRSNNQYDFCLIYGLDADLLFLSIINCPDAVLVRENVNFRNRDQTELYDEKKYPYLYLSVLELRKKIIDTLSPLSDVKKLCQMGLKNYIIREEDIDMLSSNTSWYQPENHEDRLVYDYLYICFFLGNDFLPHLPSLKICYGSLDDIIFIYKKISWTFKTFLVEKNSVSDTQGSPGMTGINRNFLKEFLAEVAFSEVDVLCEQATKRLRSIDSFNRKLRGMPKYEKDIERYRYIEDKYEDMIQVSTDGWESRYYKFNQGFDWVKQKTAIKDMCENYIDMTIWILGYYQGKHDNWSMIYKYYVAPLASDLHKHFCDLKTNNIIVNDLPASPYRQLMSILPPESASLLPKCLARYMTDPESEIHYLYPIKTQSLMYGNKFLYECKMKLPLINSDILDEIITNAPLTSQEKKRNQIGKIITLSHPDFKVLKL
jgi:5'-3' exonuclease